MFSVTFSSSYRWYRLATLPLALFELLAGGTLAFDPATGVVIAHALRIADLLHVVHRDVEAIRQAAGARVAPGPSPGPFAVGCHQHDRDVGDRGSWFHECLDAVMFGDPLPQVFQVRGRVVAAASRRAPTAPEPVEQTHRGPNPFFPRLPPSIVPEHWVTES